MPWVSHNLTLCIVQSVGHASRASHQGALLKLTRWWLARFHQDLEAILVQLVRPCASEQARADDAHSGGHIPMAYDSLSDATTVNFR